jgi:DNA-binding XRE family transcriptional regulator
MANELEHLPRTIVKARLERGMGTVPAAQEIGIGRQTLLRLEAGQGATTLVLRKVLNWLDGSPTPRLAKNEAKRITQTSPVALKMQELHDEGQTWVEAERLAHEWAKSWEQG